MLHRAESPPCQVLLSDRGPCQEQLPSLFLAAAHRSRPEMTLCLGLVLRFQSLPRGESSLNGGDGTTTSSCRMAARSNLLSKTSDREAAEGKLGIALH